VHKTTNRLIGKRARHIRAAQQLVSVNDPEATVEVFFATNRSRDEDDYFGILDAGAITWGIATVYVPPGHPDGALEKELQVAAIETFDEATFHERLAQATGDEGLFSFVHGYNNSFEYAARRAAQVTHDLNRPMVPVLFSWPTRGGTWFATAKYTFDENAAARSSSSYARLLGGLLERHDAPVVVMAHSMGSRVVSEALVDLDRQYALPRRLEQLVFAAPDVDAKVFAQRYLGVASQVSGRMTLYCANDDRALKLSRGVHGGYDRLGSCREESMEAIHRDGVEVVDASMLYVDLLDHDKVASSPRLLKDLDAVLAGVSAEDPSRGLKLVGARFELPP
jgi:esterase/lipase superfamily enzyme